MNELERSWDELFVRWIQGGLSFEERQRVLERCQQDPDFRESFCDWVRQLRKAESK
jgi:anti-sigma-K factor RskA